MALDGKRLLLEKNSIVLYSLLPPSKRITHIGTHASEKPKHQKHLNETKTKKLHITNISAFMQNKMYV